MIDIVIVLAYVIGMLLIGYKVSGTTDNQEDYYIGGRAMPWFPIALSIAATTLSANSLIAGPGWSYTSGLSVFMMNISIPFVLVLASTVFTPFLYNLKITSCYEYLNQRFGKGTQTLCSLGFMIMSLVQISSMVYVPSLIVSQLTGISLKAVIPVVVIVSIIYTTLGGIKAVIWTDAIQMGVLLTGLGVIVAIVLDNTDASLFKVLEIARDAGKLDALSVPITFSSENNILVALIGGGIMYLQYYVTDQSQVQRMFAAKSVSDVKKSIALSGVIMNSMYFIFMLVGVIMFVYYNGRTFEDTNRVMIDFIGTKMPTGLFGLVIAAVFAAAMSSVDSILNSMSAVFYKNVYAPFFKKENTDSDLKISRLFTVAVSVLVILFVYLGFMGKTSAILAVVGEYISYISGSILAVFLLGMFTNYASDKTASIGFVVGVVVTAIVAKTTPVNWLWYNVIGLGSCFIASSILSLFCQNTKNFDHALTFKGQMKHLREKTQTNDDTVMLGKLDRYSYILLAFFIFQFLFLLCIR